MNFYQFYKLLSENTVSQELKKFKQSKMLKEKETIKTLAEEVKQSLFPQNMPNLNENSKNIITNWFLFVCLKEITFDSPNWFKWIDSVTGKNDKRSAEVFVSGLHDKINKRLRREFVRKWQSCYDYIAANTDDQGNLNPQLASKFNNPAFTINDLGGLNDQYHDDLKKGKTRVPGRAGKAIVEFSDGYKWVDLGVGYCGIEGRSMGHCGNINTKPGDTILSLRDSKNVPHLTFILNNDTLGERKAVGNSKPTEKYHKYIIELLKLPNIKYLGRGDYLPENDFKLTDLTKEQSEELLKIKPTFSGSVLLDSFEELIKADQLGAITDKPVDIQALLSKKESKELELLFKFYDNVLKGHHSVDDVFSESELLELTTNENISFVDKFHSSRMGERLEIDRVIARKTKYESVHEKILEKFKAYNEPTAWSVLLALALNHKTSESIKLYLIKIDHEDLLLSRAIAQFLFLNHSKDLIKAMFEKALPLYIDDLHSTEKDKAVQIMKAIYRIADTPKEIIKQIKGLPGFDHKLFDPFLPKNSW